MENKGFAMRRRFGLTKEGLTKMFRLIRGNGKEGVYATLDASEDLIQPASFNVQAHILAKRRMHEIETLKAITISQMRHQTWKAGGPL